LNGNFAVAKCASNGQCIIYSKDWQSTRSIDGLYLPFEVIQYGDELLVTCNGSKSIEVFSVHNFHKLRSIKMSNDVLGMTKCNGALYVAYRNKIIKIDTSGKIQREYKSEGSNTIISATKHGHLVYSSCDLHTVTTITDHGDTL
jgi:hypothetical protein